MLASGIFRYGSARACAARGKTTLRSDIYYRQLAQETLKQAGIAEPPIAVEELAASYYIPVRTVNFPGFFSGATIYEDGLPVILVNSAKDEIIRRRALAHMLGHVLVVLDDPSEGYPRNTQPEHRVADLMADEIILPEFAVRDQAAKWFNDHRYLARLFGVPENDMMKKMLDLGLIKQRGILWDY